MSGPSKATSITIACWRIAWTSSIGGGLARICARADRPDALRQNPDEAAVGVDDREAGRRGGG